MGNIVFGGQGDDVGPAGKLADQYAAFVADEVGPAAVSDEAIRAAASARLAAANS